MNTFNIAFYIYLLVLICKRESSVTYGIKPIPMILIREKIREEGKGDWF